MFTGEFLTNSPHAPCMHWICSHAVTNVLNCAYCFECNLHRTRFRNGSFSDNGIYGNLFAFDQLVGRWYYLKTWYHTKSVCVKRQRHGDAFKRRLGFWLRILVLLKAFITKTMEYIKPFKAQNYICMCWYLIKCLCGRYVIFLWKQRYNFSLNSY